MRLKDLPGDVRSFIASAKTIVVCLFVFLFFFGGGYFFNANFTTVCDSLTTVYQLFSASFTTVYQLYCANFTTVY